MTTIATLSPDIGQTQRVIGALLDRLITPAGLSFPEWVLLFSIDTTGPRPAADLVRRLVDAQAAGSAEAQESIERLRSNGLIEPDAGGAALVMTAAGESVFRPIRTEVSRLTEAIYGDLPQPDLQVAHRILDQVYRRAKAQLTSSET
jgi:DNA-binding MarR family transcriptional regulator